MVNSTPAASSISAPPSQPQSNNRCLQRLTRVSKGYVKRARNCVFRIPEHPSNYIGSMRKQAAKLPVRPPPALDWGRAIQEFAGRTDPR